MTSADLVSFATPCVGNSDLAERLRFGAPLAQHEHTTFYDGDRRR